MELSNQQIFRAAAEMNNYPIWKGVWGTVLVAEQDSQKSRIEIRVLRPGGCIDTFNVRVSWSVLCFVVVVVGGSCLHINVWMRVRWVWNSASPNI